MKITDEMVGRANAVAPEMSFGVVKAMLEAALSGAALSYEERMRLELAVMAERFPNFMSDFLKRLRLFSIALVYHNGRIENDPTAQTAEEATEAAIEDFSSRFGVKAAEDLKSALCRSLWDASEGFQAIKRI